MECERFLLVGLQLQEELHAARQDASRQHVRQLKLDLKTAQMTSAALQKQVRQSHAECPSAQSAMSVDVGCWNGRHAMPRLTWHGTVRPAQIRFQYLFQSSYLHFEVMLSMFVMLLKIDQFAYEAKTTSTHKPFTKRSWVLLLQARASRFL